MPGSIRFLLLGALLLLTGCPPQEDQPTGASPTSSVPVEPLPARGILLEYEGLRLGMNSLEIAQLYNAPDGQGEGFKRVVQDFGAVQHHIVQFDPVVGEPQRKLVLALLRDELYTLVDRRDALSASQAEQWRTGLTAAYGEHSLMSIGGAQWLWGPENGVELTFTQDNSNDRAMSATAVLVFQPYAEAAYNYLAEWHKANPDFEAQELPF